MLASGRGGGPAGRISRHVPGLPGVAVLTAAALTALKLARLISWSWWLVLSPLQALAGVVALLFAGIVITAVIGACADRRHRTGRR